MEERYQHKKHRIWIIYQGLNRYRTETGRPKLTKIDYNTAAHLYILKYVVILCGDLLMCYKLINMVGLINLPGRREDTIKSFNLWGIICLVCIKYIYINNITCMNKVFIIVHKLNSGNIIT